MTIQGLERKIYKFEGLRVRMLHSNGRDVRSDKEVGRRYPHRNRASRSMSVSEWVRSRFEPNFPSLRCEVLDHGGHPVHGRTQLWKVREG
jgi:hypothetical protein